MMGEALETTVEDVQPALRRFAQEAAWIEARDGDRWRARSRSGVWHAARAASCLLEPRAGDKVLIACSEDGEEAYVLAVLTRASDASTEIAVEGDLRLVSRDGRVEMAGRTGLRMVTPADLETSAGTMTMRAQEAKLFVKSMAYLGREIVSQVRAVKLAGGRLDGAWESIRQQAKRVYRTATEGEYVRAATFDVRCDNHLELHGENAAITAKQLVKMDAGQIVMG